MIEMCLDYRQKGLREEASSYEENCSIMDRTTVHHSTQAQESGSSHFYRDLIFKRCLI